MRGSHECRQVALGHGRRLISVARPMSEAERRWCPAQAVLGHGGRWRRTEKLELFKELVQTLYNLVPPDDYDAGRPVASAWSTEFGQIMSRLEARARQDVHAWLRHIPGERYHDSLQRRLDGNCVWMLSESLFQQWMTWELSPGPNILWLHRPAGFGKTIMCANMIQHLTATLATPTAHFFFSSDASSSRDDPFLAMRSWVSQVISTHDGAFQLALCLLKNGRYSADDLDFGRSSACRHACAFGLTSVLEVMIGLGADPCFVDTVGTTPLSLASSSKNIEAVKMLLQNNASALMASRVEGLRSTKRQGTGQQTLYSFFLTTMPSPQSTTQPQRKSLLFTWRA
ncbi:hypothetical protein HYQ45_003924 [Verticillium longisporum]|uniref:Nephrocystin 3-like N-terminal domain-containing protein n=1 Tax=Verticillium longisporum TaxID=100787 RepID=A0A8I3ATQ3_VERLO|nr:hypothetical protein HYQ45_003924 [Verticillium longisporum]